MIMQTIASRAPASSAPASANHGDMPGASHYNHEPDSTNGALEEPVTMAPIAEASEQPDLLALLFGALARIDSPLPGYGINENLHPPENLRTHDIEALGRLERVDAQSHDAYLCEARRRHFGARRQRVNKMQSSYFVEIAAGG